MGGTLLALAMVLAFLASSCSPATVANTPPATALFVLGDSSVNCGDNTIFLPLLPPNLYSPTPFWLLPDLIAEKMGVGRVPPFYGLDGTVEGMMAGVNFGSSPATIISPASSDSGGVWGLFMFHTLSQQVRQAYETLQLLRLQLGPFSAAAEDTSLFLLSFGKDDLFGAFERGVVAPKYGRRGLPRFLAAHMIRAVKELYNADVRRMAVMGVGPLGCAPRVLFQGSTALEGRDCLDEANEVVARYNEMLSAGLRQASSQLPDAQIVFCDVYRGMMEIISKPLAYGFENVRDACCGAGLFGGMIGCLVQEMACSEPSRYVWWDPYSTTEAVNTLLADWAWSPDAKLRICEPVSLQQLAAAN